MEKPDQKAVKQSVDAVKGTHEKVSDLLGKLGKKIDSLAKAAAAKDVDEAALRKQMGEVNKQMELLQTQMRTMSESTKDMINNVK